MRSIGVRASNFKTEGTSDDLLPARSAHRAVQPGEPQQVAPGDAIGPVRRRAELSWAWGKLYLTSVLKRAR